MKYLLFLCTALTLQEIKLFAQEIDSVFIRNEGLTPPNTLLIPGNRYLDETEIANIHWLEFLHYALKDSSKAYYESMLPDTMLWKNFNSPRLVARNGILDSILYSGGYSEHYLRYPGYRYFPVVGITYHQASEYCKWRSEAVNIKVNQNLAARKKNYRVRYKYFLPDIADFEYASREFSARKIMDRKTSRLIKTVAPDFDRKSEFWKAAVSQKISETQSGRQVYVESYNFIGYIYENGNQWSFYNVLGNVSEITAEEGKSFGGAWIHSMDEIMTNKIFPYRKPEYWLGLRCACTVEIIRL